ncbi:Mut7-C RNAse domain-containing protein, partial [Chloroflexota bacterium]
QVLTDFDLEPDHSFSRCPVCNEPLETMNHETARTKVPAYVAQTHETFRSCPACQRVYWRGSHWRQMDQHLARLLRSYENPT